MSTVYTLNGKVLKNAANDKWLAKKEGSTFDTITIGNQIWMSSNMAIDDGGDGISIVNDVTANNVNFGTVYYYSQSAAERIVQSLASQGWRLPTSTDYQTLVSSAGSYNAIRSTSGWDNGSNGTNTSGFNMIPVGRYTGSVSNAGACCPMRTSSNLVCVGYTSGFTNSTQSAFMNNGCIVRLVKDVS